MEIRPPWGSFGVSGHLHTHRNHDPVIGNQRTTDAHQSCDARGGLQWSYLVALCVELHADFGIQLEWSSTRGAGEYGQPVTSKSRPGAMWDGRFAHLGSAGRPGHLCELGWCWLEKEKSRGPSVFVPEICSRIRERWSLRVPGISALLRLTGTVDVSPAVGVAAYPSQPGPPVT